jgi:hypothetical protein
MLSEMTISFGSRSFSFPALYLLIGLLIILGFIGITVAIASARRTRRQTSELLDILVAQLDRIGDSLDRLVSQRAAHAIARTPKAATPVSVQGIQGEGQSPQSAINPATRIHFSLLGR